MNENGKVPGQGAATASLVCGIIAVICSFLGYTLIIALILGIVGLVQASKSKQEGFNGGLRTAGFVLSLIGLIFGAIALVPVFACVACGGTLGVLGALA